MIQINFKAKGKDLRVIMEMEIKDFEKENKYLINSPSLQIYNGIDKKKKILARSQEAWGVTKNGAVNKHQFLFSWSNLYDEEIKSMMSSLGYYEWMRIGECYTDHKEFNNSLSPSAPSVPIMDQQPGNSKIPKICSQMDFIFRSKLIMLCKGFGVDFVPPAPPEIPPTFSSSISTASTTSKDRMLQMGVTIPTHCGGPDRYSGRMMDILVKSFVFDCDARGLRTPGKIIAKFGNMFCDVTTDWPETSKETVQRAVVAQAILCEEKFMKVLPNLNDIFIMTDGTTLDATYWEQLLLGGFDNDGECKVHVADVAKTAKHTGEAMCSSIVDTLKEIESLSPGFKMANVKYLVGDHSSNNSGKINGLIGHLQRNGLPGINFTGCKDHLFNLCVKAMDRAASKMLIEDRPGMRQLYGGKKAMVHMQEFINLIKNYQCDLHQEKEMKFPKLSLNRYLHGFLMGVWIFAHYDTIMKLLDCISKSPEREIKATEISLLSYLPLLKDNDFKFYLLLCCFFDDLFRKTLYRFHHTTSLERSGKIYRKFLTKIKAMQDNPNMFIAEEIVDEDSFIDDGQKWSDSMQSNALSSFQFTMLQSICETMHAKATKWCEYPIISSDANGNIVPAVGNVMTTSRIIERSFGSLCKFLKLSKRGSPFVFRCLQIIRLCQKSGDLPSFVDMCDDEIKPYRKLARDALANKITYRESMMSIKSFKFAPSTRRLCKVEFIPEYLNEEDTEILISNPTPSVVVGVKRKLDNDVLEGEQSQIFSEPTGIRCRCNYCDLYIQEGAANEDCIQCDFCDKWIHWRCIESSTLSIARKSTFKCNKCKNPSLYYPTEVENPEKYRKIPNSSIMHETQ